MASGSRTKLPPLCTFTPRESDRHVDYTKDHQYFHARPYQMIIVMMQLEERGEDHHDYIAVGCGLISTIFVAQDKILIATKQVDTAISHWRLANTISMCQEPQSSQEIVDRVEINVPTARQQLCKTPV